MRVTFSIADIAVMLKTPFPVMISERFRPFYTQEEADYIAEFVGVRDMQILSGDIMCCDSGFDVISDGEGGFIRRFQNQARNNIVYADGFYDWDKRSIRVQYISEGIPCINHTDGAFYHIAWEEMMLWEKRLLLHACCIDIEGYGILFSGRSGIGKSTQGDLWCRYEDATLINGDRPILYKKDGVWTAFGSPYAGSSKCHVNRSVPVRAIVMLLQAESCSIHRLGTADAFRRVFAQLTISVWNPECVNIAFTLAKQLVTDIPVYEMACTPDLNAVELLKNTLRQEVKYESKS